MVKKLTDEERLELIKKVGEYFLETGSSVREVSRIFNEEYNIEISGKTVSKYIHEYAKNFGKKDEIESKISNNTSKSIEDSSIQSRVLSAARLALEGKTIKEIAKELNSTENVIKGDLSKRLYMYSLVDEDMGIYYDAVKNVMSKNLDDSLNDNEILKRVITVSKLILEGYTNKEIADMFNVSESVIQRDIHDRLKAFCENDEDMIIYYNAVRNVLENNKNSNLKK